MIKKELEIELVKFKYVDNPNKLQSELKELNQIHVIDEKLHEIKNEISRDYVGEFEMVGRLKLADETRETHNRFGNLDDFESYITAIDQHYDSESGIFKDYIYKINTPQINLVNRSQYGNGCDFVFEIIEYRGNNCFIPTNGFCFVKRIRFVTGEDFREQY